MSDCDYKCIFCKTELTNDEAWGDEDDEKLECNSELEQNQHNWRTEECLDDWCKWHGCVAYDDDFTAKELQFAGLTLEEVEDSEVDYIICKSCAKDNDYLLTWREEDEE